MVRKVLTVFHAVIYWLKQFRRLNFQTLAWTAPLRWMWRAAARESLTRWHQHIENVCFWSLSILRPLLGQWGLTYRSVKRPSSAGPGHWGNISLLLKCFGKPITSCRKCQRPERNWILHYEVRSWCAMGFYLLGPFCCIISRIAFTISLLIKSVWNVNLVKVFKRHGNWIIWRSFWNDAPLEKAFHNRLKFSLRRSTSRVSGVVV